MELINSISYAINMVIIIIIIIIYIVYRIIYKNNNTVKDVDIIIDEYMVNYDEVENLEYVCNNEPSKVQNCIIYYHKNEDMYIVGLAGFSDNLLLNKLVRIHPAYHYNSCTRDADRYYHDLQGYKYITHYTIMNNRPYDLVLYANNAETIVYVIDIASYRTIKVYRINE